MCIGIDWGVRVVVVSPEQQVAHIFFLPIACNTRQGDDLDAFSRRLQKTFALSYEQVTNLFSYGI